MRSMPANPYGGHTLAEALAQAAIPRNAISEVAIVDRGYKGAAVDGMKIYHHWLAASIFGLAIGTPTSQSCTVDRRVEITWGGFRQHLAINEL